MQENEELELLLKNIQQGLKKYSVKELNQALNVALRNSSDNKYEIDCVLNIVTKHYKISVRSIKNAHTRGNIQDAKQIAYCLLHFNLGFPIRYIARRIFNNWAGSVFNGIKRFKNAKADIKPDKEFLDTYDTLNKELLQLLKKQEA